MMMLMNQYPAFFISSSTDKTNINKNQQENLEMIYLQPVNKLMMNI